MKNPTPATVPSLRFLSLQNLLLALLLLTKASFAQLTTFTINSAPDTPLNSSNANWSDYITYALPSSYMTGATVSLKWSDVDTGTYAGGCPSISFTSFDNSLAALYKDATNNGKMINFIVIPVTEGGSNNSTPGYVYSQTWSNYLADPGNNSCNLSPTLGNISPQWAASSAFLPLDYIYANGVYWQETARPWSSSNQFSATCTTGSTEPAFNKNTSSYTDNTCTWTNKGVNAPLQDACFSSNYHGNNNILNANNGNAGCFNMGNLPGNTGEADLQTGFNVSYETPVKVAWKYFVQQVISRYQNNQASLGITLGYIRFGLSEGGESVPLVSGNWPDFANQSGRGPASGASIEYLSYINDMMQFQNNNNQKNGNNLPINLLADLNTWDNIADYPDQEALYAVDNNLGFGTNGLQVNDVTNINPPGGTCTGSNENISGDWCYNFGQYCAKKMPNGNYPICSLQTLQLSDPGNNAAGNTGSLSDEYWDSSSGWTNFFGLIPAAKQYGATNLEIYTCDIIYTADSSYSSSNCKTSGKGNLEDAAHENDYQHSFTAFLTASAPGIYSPVPGSNTTSDTSLALQWNAYPGATSYTIQIGNSQGSQNYYHNTVSRTSVTANFSGSGAPQGSDVWVRWTPNNGSSVDYHFIAK